MAKWIYSNGMAVCVDIGSEIIFTSRYLQADLVDGGFLDFDIGTTDESLCCGWTKGPIVHACGWCLLARLDAGNRQIFLNPTPAEGQIIQMPSNGKLYIYEENMREKRLKTVCADPLVLYYMAKAWEMNTSLEFQNLPSKERIRLQKELLESRPTREEARAEIRRLGVSEKILTLDEACESGKYDAWYEKRERDEEEYKRLHPELFQKER